MNKIKKITNRFLTIGLFSFCVLILLLSIRGINGNPESRTLNSDFWKDKGPFELSPERGRFALVYSLIEDKSFYFSERIARFAMPDLGYKNGHFVSIFAPGVSFLVIPGYLIGKLFGIGQVGAFAIIALFALFNAFLIRKIAVALGANTIAASLGALVFLFATPAFAYGVNLYQHHISTFLILASIYMLFSFRSIWSLVVIWFLFAMSIPIDYPNLFLMFPIAIAAFLKNFSVEKITNKINLKIKITGFLAICAVIVPLTFFMWFNFSSYGNPFQFSGTVQGVRGLNEFGNPITPKSTGVHKNPIAFFQTRNILNGFYIHFVSPDRGVAYYTPVVLFGIIGFFLALRKKIKIVPLLTAIVGANILLYSMWGDPWGGWAFGSRYLIPTYAILSIFIALLITYWRKKVLFWSVFIVTAFYSIAVNTLGAITTSAIPPKVEVLNLEKLSGLVQRYTYERNWDFLVSGHSKSFIYQTFAKDYLTSIQYYQIIVVPIFLVIGGLILYYIVFGKDKND